MAENDSSYVFDFDARPGRVRTPRRWHKLLMGRCDNTQRSTGRVRAFRRRAGDVLFEATALPIGVISWFQWLPVLPFSPPSSTPSTPSTPASQTTHLLIDSTMRRGDLICTWSGVRWSPAEHLVITTAELHLDGLCPKSNHRVTEIVDGQLGLIICVVESFVCFCFFASNRTLIGNMRYFKRLATMLEYVSILIEDICYTKTLHDLTLWLR